MSARIPISVVMPVHNGQRFVEEAIRSVLAQTFGDFEFVIVDDGSTDQTPVILRDCAAHDSRIVLRRQTSNLGFRTALNVGCALAAGEYIARMDADDVCLPMRFERQLEYLQRDSAVCAVGSGVQVIDESGRLGEVKSYPNEPALAAWSMLFSSSMAHPAVMLRRAALERAGFYPAGCKGGTEDYALFMRLSHSGRISNLRDVLLMYRVWGGNMTTTKLADQLTDGVRILREALLEHSHVDLPFEQAQIIQGFAYNRYPSNRHDIAVAAGVLENLLQAFAARKTFAADEVRGVRRDAAVKYWLLAALALRSGSPLFPALAAKALRMDPASLITFAAKAWRNARAG